MRTYRLETGGFSHRTVCAFRISKKIKISEILQWKPNRITQYINLQRAQYGKLRNQYEELLLEYEYALRRIRTLELRIESVQGCRTFKNLDTTLKRKQKARKNENGTGNVTDRGMGQVGP